MRLRLMLLLLGCGLGCAVPRPAAPAAAVAAGVSYLALGDSYTIGQGVAKAERWPVQLAEMARQQGVRLRAPAFVARTGWTTAELARAIEQAPLARRYDLVSLQIGVNNHYRGQSVAGYRAEFRELLRTAVRLAGNRAGRVLVLSLPDWGQSPFATGQNRARIGAEIDQFNAEARQECQALGVAFIDITPLSRAAANAPAQFAPDGLHYAGPHLRRWARQALPVAKAAVCAP